MYFARCANELKSYLSVLEDSFGAMVMIKWCRKLVEGRCNTLSKKKNAAMALFKAANCMMLYDTRQLR